MDRKVLARYHLREEELEAEYIGNLMLGDLTAFEKEYGELFQELRKKGVHFFEGPKFMDVALDVPILLDIVVDETDFKFVRESIEGLNWKKRDGKLQSAYFIHFYNEERTHRRRGQ